MPRIKTTVVGSYPVPEWLLAAPSEQALVDATRVVIATQEAAGIDVVCDGQEPILLTSPRFESRNTQGTGCTFASAIAAGLARGVSPLEAIKRAKEYITEAIRSGPSIGSGHAPANHLTGVHSKW